MLRRTLAPIALALAITALGLVLDHQLVRVVGRRYWSLPRLEFFLMIWPLVAIIAGTLLVRSRLAPLLGRSLIFSGVPIAIGTALYFGLYLSSSLS